MSFSTTNARPPEVPRKAATLVILRDAPHGLEVLLTTRPQALRFMGGATVFPGGAVAPADLDPRWEEASTLSRAEAQTAIGEPDENALGLYVCALREAFEEVGFIVGEGDLTTLSDGSRHDPELFLQACLRDGIRLGTHRLACAGRWVTPVGSPMRFDTAFFVTQAPPEWVPQPDPDEVEDCRWVTPSEGLAELSSGRALMAPPTIETLQLLDRYGSVAQAATGLQGGGVSGPGRVLATRLSPLVQLVLAPNPGLMTGPGTNSYVIGTGPTCVIDPAVDDDEYLSVLREVAGEIDLILVTHRHADHVGGAARLASQTGAQVFAFGNAAAGEAAVRSLADGERVGVGGARLVEIGRAHV